MKKSLNLLLTALLAISVVLAIFMVFDKSEVSFGDKLFTHGVSASWSIVWTYILIGAAVLAALACAAWGMIQHPAGLRATLLSVALVVVIVLVAYFIANAHSFEIPNLAAGGIFPRSQTVLSDTSILVTYVALGGTILAAIFSEIYKAFR